MPRERSESGAGSARLWNAGTGALLATLAGHSGAVNSAALSPDGSHVITASDDGTARLWNAGVGIGLQKRRKGAQPLAGHHFRIGTCRPAGRRREHDAMSVITHRAPRNAAAPQFGGAAWRGIHDTRRRVLICTVGGRRTSLCRRIRRDDRLTGFALGVGGMLTSFISDGSKRGRSPLL